MRHDGAGGQQPLQAQARVGAAHALAGVAHAEHGVHAAAGEGVVGLLEPAGGLDGLLAEDHAVAVLVLADDGQRLRLDLPGGVLAVGAGRVRAGCGAVGPAHGGGLEVEGAVGGQVLGGGAQDAVGQVGGHHAVAAPGGGLARLVDGGQSREGAGLEGGPGGQGVEGAQDAGVLEPAAAGGQGGDQGRGGDRQGLLVAGLVEAGRQQLAAAVQVDVDQDGQAGAGLLLAGHQGVPALQQRAQLGGQGRQDLLGQVGGAPLEDAALGAQDRAALGLVQGGDDLVERVEQLLRGAVEHLVEPAQVVQVADDGGAGLGDGPHREPAQTHEGRQGHGGLGQGRGLRLRCRYRRWYGGGRSGWDGLPGGHGGYGLRLWLLGGGGTGTRENRLRHRRKPFKRAYSQ